MPLDYGLLNNQKSILDAQQLQQAFELKKQLAAAELTKALTPELPANIREYGIFQNMDPASQRLYTDFIKAKTPSYGGDFAIPGADTAPVIAEPLGANIPPPAGIPVEQPKITDLPGFVPPVKTPPAITISQPAPIDANEGRVEIPSLPPVENAAPKIPPLQNPNVQFYKNKKGEYNTKGANPGYAWARIDGVDKLAKLPGAPDEITFKNENVLRDEFNTRSKDFITVQDAYSKIKKTSNTGPGDMSMLYAYVKLLDPGSVVRESEFATAAASGSLGERIQGAVKSIQQGGRLEPELREKFLKEADNIYQGQKEGYDRLTGTYTDIAERNGLNPKNIITNYAAAVPKNNNPGLSTPSGIKYRVVQ